MRLASLAMYVQPPELADATGELWRFIQGRLTDIGMVDIPRELDRNIAHDAAWLHPDLLLSQTCGYPYVTSLRGRVRLVATPIYNHAGCEGPLQCSFIITRRDQKAGELSDMRNSRVAINDDASNSGMNVLRAAIAPLAMDGHFFSEVIKTGGHVHSIESVATGQTDVAAIDCVTFGNIRRFDPERLSHVRILA
ncbi:phosphate/phosphite/phosphonate ABC transporter substrate-binding protein [Rhizobium sp. CFBP 8762]|uniref:phosphate/phosphite/phosphonate ABC transporter substrate-binding protein n=1 Tax=Rhizobium sp. CFBP 8762 TaxID=2775279 RepID=UPI00313B5AE0